MRIMSAGIVALCSIFFENYEKLKYWLYLEEVYEEMLKDPFWSEYKIEQCQQDLTMLTEWKNLNTIQDTRRVSSIEDLKIRVPLPDVGIQCRD